MFVRTENSADDLNIFQSEFILLEPEMYINFAFGNDPRKSFLGIIFEKCNFLLLVENDETRVLHDENSRYLDLH
jgi:hypothetical protein